MTRTSKGQAVLEYLLLISVSIMIISGLTYAFYKPFAEWADQLLGKGEDSYLGCLIKEGILPGGETVTCQMPKFQWKKFPDDKVKPINGGDVNPGSVKPGSANAGNGSSGGGGGGGAGNSGNIRGGNASGGKSSGGGAGRQSSSSKDSGGGGGAGSLTSVGNDSGFGSKRGRGGGGRGGEGEAYTGSDKSSSSVAVGEDGSSRKNDGSSSGGFANALRRTLNERTRSVVQTNPPSKLKTAREIAAEKEKRKRLLEEERKPFSFGNFLKYLVIAALIFAIIFFVGSQIVSVARGGGRRRG